MNIGDTSWLEHVVQRMVLSAKSEEKYKNQMIHDLPGLVQWLEGGVGGIVVSGEGWAVRKALPGMADYTQDIRADYLMSLLLAEGTEKQLQMNE